MTRSEIRQRFRDENPEITERVITDATLNSWLISGNLEIATMTRCIVSNVSQTFNTVASTKYYDLTEKISKFYDIDDMPGGGVYYDDVPLKKVTIGEMNYRFKNWRTAGTGTPRVYWRRGKFIWFHPTPNAVQDVDIDCVFIADDFNSDAVEPFNQLTHLEPFHDGLVKYLQRRTKQKIGKPEEAAQAEKDYMVYVKWMGKTIRGANQGAIHFRVAATA